MKTNNFYNNGSFNDEAMRGIKDAVYLAKRAYDNKDKLDNLSKPLNKDFPEDPLKSEDGYTMLYYKDTKALVLE